MNRCACTLMSGISGKTRCLLAGALAFILALTSHIDSAGIARLHSAPYNMTPHVQGYDMAKQVFNTAALRKHAALFTLAAGVTAGGIMGFAALQQETPVSAPVSAPSVQDIAPAPAAPSPVPRATAALPVAAEVTHVAADKSLHVRAHVWVAQFNTVSLCPAGIVADCRYSAELRDAAGAPVQNPRAGQRVYLHGLQETGNINAAQPQPDAPALRPRSDIVKGPVAARVTKTGDGDTVQTVVDIWPGMQVLIDIRIGEIDTPEKKGRAKCAQEAELAEAATAETRRLLEGKRVLLYNVKYEKYGGRVLADVVTENGINAAKNLTDKGYAVPYDGGKKQSWCTIAQRP